MTRALAGLQPEPLWRYFEELCAIPHPSKHEAAISRYLADTGRRLGLATTVDALGNVIITKEATPGMQDGAPLCLQSHMDMVPQKNPEVAHDFVEDPIRPGLDAISFGPTIRFPHSPDEHVYIASVARFWSYLTAVLAAIGRGLP
jgi:dipeptidase D